MIFVILNTLALYSAPTSSWYLDELGTSNYNYIVNDDIGSNDGKVYSTASTGNENGKICSALDFSANSTYDYAKLKENSLDGVTDFTVSIWLKGSSTAGRSLLSAANSSQYNEFLMWFPSDTSFDGHIDGKTYPDITFPSIADNSWHHFVWRRIGDQGCVFTDNVNRGCVTISTKTLIVESLILGQEQDSVGGSFDINQDWEGLVDELLFFREGLSEADISFIYNHQNAGKNWNGTARTCQTTATPIAIDYGYSDWHFDEESWNGIENEIHDEHGGNHGKGYKVTSVEGKICTAMDFQKSSTLDYALLGKGALDGVEDFTVSVWHKGVAGTDSNALLSGANSSEDNEFLFWFINETTFAGHLNGKARSISSSNINTNSWRHLVWRRAGNESCFFIDNTKQGCQQYTSSTLNITSLILGQEQDNVGGKFDSGQDWEGVLDELIIFRRALNDSDISSIYNNQNAGKNWDGTKRVCPGMPNLSIEKTSIVTKDPINSNNPKRIPGATIRYCFTVDNSGKGQAEDLKIEDTLTGDNKANLTYVSSGKIIQDISDVCDCATISDTSGSINGDDVLINTSSLDVDKRICAYIEMLIE